MNNELTNKLAREFFQNMENKGFVREVVSSVPEAVRNFAELTARVVEAQDPLYLTMSTRGSRSGHIPMWQTRLWSESPKMQNGRPDIGISEDNSFIAEIYLRTYENDLYQAQTPNGLLNLLNSRNVGANCNDSHDTQTNIYDLSIIPTEKDTSPTAKIVLEALLTGVPVGETEPRQPKMRFENYLAGHGRVGRVQKESGYVLQKENDIFFVTTQGLFCMDSNDKLTGAILVPDKDCYGCYFGGHTERIIEGLEKTLQEKDLRNKQVFLVGNGQYSKGQSVCDTSYEVKQMFESRGAKVFPTEEEINPNK